MNNGEAASRSYDVDDILDFARVSERLKTEMRHSWLSDGRQESVAEHTWHMTLLAVLTRDRLARSVDLEKTLKLIIVHDLVEAISGDVPVTETGPRRVEKARREREAIQEIRSLLRGGIGDEIQDLWFEFEEGQTDEARFARALDHLEVQIQHNLAPLETWEPAEYDLVYTKMDVPCQHDHFLSRLCEAVKAQATHKMNRRPLVLSK